MTTPSSSLCWHGWSNPLRKQTVSVSLPSLVSIHRITTTFLNCLVRANERDYRRKIAEKCFAHSVATTGISLLLYDVTTLYFEAEKEDDLRQVGYSKERRVDPQIVVGLLVDRTGFPLEIGCFEGAKAETHTIIPVIKTFQDRHGVTDMVAAADAGMLSAKNLKELDDAGRGSSSGPGRRKLHTIWLPIFGGMANTPKMDRSSIRSPRKG